MLLMALLLLLFFLLPLWTSSSAAEAEVTRRYCNSSCSSWTVDRVYSGCDRAPILSKSLWAYMCSSSSGTCMKASISARAQSWLLPMLLLHHCQWASLSRVRVLIWSKANTGQTNATRVSNTDRQLTSEKQTASFKFKWDRFFSPTRRRGRQANKK